MTRPLTAMTQQNYLDRLEPVLAIQMLGFDVDIRYSGDKHFTLALTRAGRRISQPVAVPRQGKHNRTEMKARMCAGDIRHDSTTYQALVQLRSIAQHYASRSELLAHVADAA